MMRESGIMDAMDKDIGQGVIYKVELDIIQWAIASKP